MILDHSTARRGTKRKQTASATTLKKPPEPKTTAKQAQTGYTKLAAAAAATAVNDDAVAGDAGALPPDMFEDLDDLPEPPSAGDDWDKKKAARPVGLPKEDHEEETAVQV